MTAGPDGALWFTNGDAIGRLTTNGLVSTYRNKIIHWPRGITLGPDGALWFANADGKSIGRVRVVPPASCQRPSPFQRCRPRFACQPGGLKLL